MADLNKFYRSKEKIREAIHYLINTNAPNEQVIKEHIEGLKASMAILDAMLKDLLKEQADKSNT